MTNSFALVFGLLILAVLAADIFYYQWDILVFLGRKLLDLSEWLAFWR
ncbi:MAG: hypothetical protein AAFW69_01630 [Pseudomonadota bacterium]